MLNRFAGVALAASLVWLALACTTSLPAPSGVLTLRAADSTLHFIGTKNNAVPVPGSFAGLTGQVNLAARSAWVQVDIGSLSTGDPERDGNIRTHFFETDAHPTARFEVSGLPNAGELPEVGGMLEMDVIGSLTLHGTAQKLKLRAFISRDADGAFRVRTATPLVLNAEQLGLQKQLAVLKAVCGHESVSGAIPVQFELVFGS